MTKPQTNLLLAVLNVVGFNALANAVPLGGKTTGELSDQYPNLFVPSGLTFLIWAVIYLLLAVYAVYGLIQSIRMPSQAVTFTQKIGLLFLVTCIANAAWILSWHNEVLPLSLILMVISLFSLPAIYIRLGIGRAAAGTAEK